MCFVCSTPCWVLYTYRSSLCNDPVCCALAPTPLHSWAHWIGEKVSTCSPRPHSQTVLKLGFDTTQQIPEPKAPTPSLSVLLLCEAHGQKGELEIIRANVKVTHLESNKNEQQSPWAAPYSAHWHAVGLSWHDDCLRLCAIHLTYRFSLGQTYTSGQMAQGLKNAVSPWT